METRNYTWRKRVLDYDNVMNQQREVIYGIRNAALHAAGEGIDRPHQDLWIDAAAGDFEAELLRDGPWPLFVQGEAPRGVLLERFRESGNGVLLGAASFREGVDVAGDALSVVVIDKLPFGAPDDPVFEARLEAVRRRGGNPFRDEQLPQAVIALKQGVGRLIRSHLDRGVLVLCDPRLVTKSYGRLFLDSLPPFPRTRVLADVQDFFAAQSEPTETDEALP